MKKLFSCVLALLVCGCGSWPEDKGSNWKKEPYSVPAYDPNKPHTKSTRDIHERTENRRHRNDSLESWTRYNNH